MKINIPQEVIEAIAQKLGLNPNPTTEQIETLVLWSLLEGLGSSAFIDYKIDKLTGGEIITELQLEIADMMKEIKADKVR